ncbi:MAG TPA: chloride channel protein [Silvibacterium sp.]|nr:chloride channel protein [Silvibacterium sp.]
MKVSDLSFGQRLRLRENQIFLVLTVLLGILSGLAAVLFTLAIKGATYLLFGMSPSIARYILVPTVVSFIAGFLLKRYFPEARGSGVPQVEAAYHLQDGYVPGRVAFGKFLTGVMCIGSGHSMGREGPSVQIAAGMASTIGRWFRLSPARARSLVPVAAAAALAGAFNTPVAAVLFALEEIIGDMNAPLIGSAVLASVSAVIVERSVLGNSPIFHVPQYRLVSPAELIAYLLLGVVGGLVSLAFCKGLLRARQWILKLPERSRLFQPAAGGLIIGVILIFVPQVMGVGYEFVNQALNGGLLLKTMLILCAVKLVATIVSYASGNAGGIFSPSLYLGAMAGGAVGMLVHKLALFPAGNPGAYALVGMGAVFAGIIRAPMTSVFMIFELTQDYQVFVPLMVANMVSFAISRQFQPTPLYHALLEQDHVHLPHPSLRSAPPSRRAQELMTPEFTMISPNASIASAADAISKTNGKAFLVGDDGTVSGLITRDLIEKEKTVKADAPVHDFAISEFEHVHPDHSLEVVIDRLGKSPGLLPVVSRSNAQQILGVITPQSLTQFVQRNWENNGGA